MQREVKSNGVLHQVTWSLQSFSLNSVMSNWELDHQVKEKQPTGIHQLWRPHESMSRVCKAVIKGKGVYCEESKIYSRELQKMAGLVPEVCALSRWV